MKSLIYFLFALVVMPLAMGAQAVDEFKFGIFAPQVAGQADRIASETLTLPYKFEESGFRWGFEYSPANPAPYNLRLVLYLPTPPATISGTLEGSKDSPTIVKSRELQETGRATRTFFFEKGDPLGEWKIEIFVDGKLAKTFKYQVVPAK